MNAVPTVSVSMRMPPDLHKAVEAAAKAAGLPLTRWLNQAAAEKLERDG